MNNSVAIVEAEFPKKGPLKPSAEAASAMPDSPTRAGRDP